MVHCSDFQLGLEELQPQEMRVTAGKEAFREYLSDHPKEVGGKVKWRGH